MAKFVTDGITVTSTTSGAGANVLYTCPSRFNSHVRFLHISCGASNNNHVTIEWYHAEDQVYHKLLNSFAMATGTAHEVGGSGAHLYLHPGDKLVCSTDASGNFDVTISVEETPRTQTD